jgi:hypothetical protein
MVKMVKMVYDGDDDDDDDDKLYLNTEKTHQYKEAIVIYKLLDSIKIQ